MTSRQPQPAELMTGLPDAPGVYLFYGSLNELLYVGKSKAIRTRVRSHFGAPEERWLMRKVRRVEIRRTAGELGALLLESQMIKELRPMFNLASRQRRRIIVARRALNPDGYAVVNLEAVDYLDVHAEEPILGVFKHKTQAREYLSMIAKGHRLCPKLLRLEQARTYCFSYHLGQCDGACMGEEAPERYNARLDEAFEARRIKAWPYESGIVIEEVRENETLRELFLIDNWCLVASYRISGQNPAENSSQKHRFDYDSYKILYSFLSDPQNESSITRLNRQKFVDLLKVGLGAFASGKPA
jgi:DNA polymerase-3 subunit epsilon